MDGIKNLRGQHFSQKLKFRDFAVTFFMNHRYQFSKKFRLYKERDIQETFKEGKKIFTASFIIIYKENSEAFCRLGICIGRKYGKAYQRNYFKRVMRESFRTMPCRYDCHLDILVLPKRGILLSKNFKHIQNTFHKTINSLITESTQHSMPEKEA